MTLCEIITNPITRMVEQEGKSLDEIAEAVCPKVKYGREKIIRIIKDFLGEEYLIQHAEILKYDVQKARIAKKRKASTQEKIDARTHSESDINCKKENEQKPQCTEKQHAEVQPTKLSFDDVVKKLMEIIEMSSLITVKSAIEAIEHDEGL
jgi:hypothetical protein